MLGAEFQGLARRGGVRDQIGRIARSTRLDDMRYLAAGLGGDGGENLAHRKARAGAEIESAAGMSLHQELQRLYMRRRKVADVNVVADRGAVGRVVIVTEYREIGDMALQRHHGPRDEMGLVIA